MKFAWLGEDLAALPLLRAIRDDPQHEIVFAYEPGELIAELSPATQSVDRWERILSQGGADAIVVCGSQESVLHAGRQLASTGKPLVLFPKSAQGSTWIYELGLIRDEGRAPVVPLFADRFRPEFAALQRLLSEEALGCLHYLRIDRELEADEESPGAALVARDALENRLLHDTDLARRLAGDYDRISAVESGASEDRLAAAGLTLWGSNLPEATWSGRGTSGPARGTIVLAGERGTVTVDCDGELWRLRADDHQISMAPTPADFDPGAEMLRVALKGISGNEGGRWSELIRGFELLDARRVSVRRRRAIDLHFEATSERNLFKSQMTAVGCGVLVMTLFGVLFLLLAMPLFDARSRKQVEAEQAQSIVPTTDFQEGKPQLTVNGKEHLGQVATAIASSRSPIYLEQSGAGGADLDRRRRDVVVAVLKEAGVHDASDRTSVGPVVGQWYATALRVVRVVVFMPLALFLALQLFLLLTRPAQSHERVSESRTADGAHADRGS